MSEAKPAVLLFDGTCIPCSKVARTVRDLPVTGITVRPLSDPEVTRRLAAAGLAVPDRPALLVTDGDNVRLLTGWRMRWRMTGIVGRRRAGLIARLAAAEWTGRLEKAARLEEAVRGHR